MDLKRVLEGLTIVAIGLVLLGVTTGYLESGVLWSILSLWPILLVAAGIDLLGKAYDNVWLRALGSLIVIGGLAFAVFVLTPGQESMTYWGLRADRPGQAFSFEEPRDPDISTAKADVRGGVGRMTVRGGSSLVTADGETPGGEPRFEVTKDGSSADVTVRPPEDPGFFSGGRRRSELNVTLDDAVVWSLRLDAGVSRLDADLSRLALSKLDVDMGVSEGSIRLGLPGDPASSARERATAEIDAGVSSLELLVPRNAAVRLSVKEGIGSVRVGEGLTKVSDDSGRRVWETDDYAASPQQWDITVDAGVSSISVERY